MKRHEWDDGKTNMENKDKCSLHIHATQMNQRMKVLVLGVHCSLSVPCVIGGAFAIRSMQKLKCHIHSQFMQYNIQEAPSGYRTWRATAFAFALDLHIEMQVPQSHCLLVIQKWLLANWLQHRTEPVTQKWIPCCCASSKIYNIFRTENEVSCAHRQHTTNGSKPSVSN